MRRVLVTGSRTWRNYAPIAMALAQQLRLAEDRCLVVVHGDAPGADTFADHWAGHRWTWAEVTAEPHAAKWEDHCPKCPGHRRVKKLLQDTGYCPAQGGIRNQLMVDLGADICLAFPVGRGWSGTRDCMTRAKKAGIPVLDLGVL